ncbi:MAG: peptidoglycan-binding protein LysM [Bacteroidota bacterium]
MGLFSFLKKSGAKVLTKKNASTVETDEIKKMQEEIFNKQKVILLKGVVKNLKIEVDNLDIDYDDETVRVYGQVGTQAEKEKVVLALGNVSGVAQVDDRLSVVKKAPEAQFYVVKRGDSLSKIAKKFYGDPMKYKELFKANQPLLKDPNKIFPGQSLRIPPMD